MSATQTTRKIDLSQKQIDVIAEALQSQYAKLINDAKDYDRIGDQYRNGSAKAENFAGLSLRRKAEAEEVAKAHKAVTS